MRVLLVLMLGAVLLSGCFHTKPRFEWQEMQEPEEAALTRSDLALYRVATGYDRPVLVLPAPDGPALVVEQTGRVWPLAADGPSGTPYLDISERVGTCHPEQGLLGLAFSPTFSDDGRLYVAYTDRPCEKDRTPERKGDLVLSRFVATPGEGPVDPATEERLLSVVEPFRNHNGGHVLFGPDGFLYLGIGDGGDHGDPHRNGQDLRTLLGTIIRIDVSVPSGHTVPPDNPFVGSATARPEIYVYGLRNPWRYTFDASDGALWIADVGQDMIEEIDRLPAGQQAGANLGWSLYEGDTRYNIGPEPADLVFPIHQYRHDAGPGHCSVTGGPVLADSGLPGLDGTYLFGDFCSGHLWALHHRDTVAVEPLGDSGLQITAFGSDHEGNVLVVHWNGDVFRLAARAATT